ncbi:MAG: isocitrate lyase/phosphoenolpyruvate mutase family protein [Octadecabacter sp.]
MSADQGATFRALHQHGAAFILANAWDIGSAKMLAGLGAQAIATSSAAHAFTLGLPDGKVDRDTALAHAQSIVAAVNLPVQGDFEDGYSDTPEGTAKTVRMAAEVGLAGICIEDLRQGTQTAYGFDLAVEKIRAAAAAARALPRDFVLTARADGIMVDAYDIDEAIRRLKAFSAAGADCLYAPMTKSFADLAQIVAQTDKPVNALVAGEYTAYGRADFAKIGVARLSLGSALARTTHRVIHDAATAMFGAGEFSALGNAMNGGIVDALLTKE